MNHAERVKELAEQYLLWESTGDELHTAIDAMQSALDHALESEKEGWRYSKEVAEYLVRLKTALDDAVAKLAARDAEVGRLRKDAERYRFIRDADRSDCITPELALYALETLDEYVDAAMEDEVRLNAAAAEEVKDDWIEYRGRDDAALSEESKKRGGV